MTRGIRSRYPLGAFRVYAIAHNHTGEVTCTREARCDELDPKGKPFAFAGNGFRKLETSNIEVSSPNH